MAAPILAVVAAGAATASLISSEKAAKSEHAAANEQAALYEQQAERILERASFAIRQARFSGQKLEGRQVVAYAASGVDVSSGSALAVMEDTARQLNDEISQIRREADFQAEQARSGAASIRALADDQRKAARISNYARFAGSLAQAGSNYMRYEAALTPEETKRERAGLLTQKEKKEFERLTGESFDSFLESQRLEGKTTEDLTEEIQDFFTPSGTQDTPGDPRAKDVEVPTLTEKTQRPPKTIPRKRKSLLDFTPAMGVRRAERRFR